MPEQEAHTAVRPEIAAVLGKGVTHVGDGARLVVGQAIDHHRRAANAVAFVAHFNVIDAFEFARAFFDRVIDLVLGHVDRLALVNRQPQPRIEARIAAAGLGGDGDFPGDFGKGSAALFVLPTLTVLDIGPFGMTCHDDLDSIRHGASSPLATP